MCNDPSASRSPELDVLVAATRHMCLWETELSALGGVTVFATGAQIPLDVDILLV